MRIKVFSESPEETQKIASLFINTVLKQKNLKRKQASLRRQALVISLEGNLGSGKTEFLKGIAKGIKLKEKVFSPTFLIMKRFTLKHKFKFLWHLDCYRLKKISEMRELDLKEIIKNPQNIIFIEWGNKIKKMLPKSHWTIKFQIKGEKERLLIFDIH
ncbi:MAG: tRNA (adenosine(37)-N6)-threonylcarbamoyltransferase complex ATPase subunit type 1 TsaE [Candidatus Paceibacterota bacterium]|jgi:tRNA threonylcarbamoyladenosine biosynthesis protein TsaE